MNSEVNLTNNLQFNLSKFNLSNAAVTLKCNKVIKKKHESFKLNRSYHYAKFKRFHLKLNSIGDRANISFC